MKVDLLRQTGTGRCAHVGFNASRFSLVAMMAISFLGCAATESISQEPGAEAGTEPEAVSEASPSQAEGDVSGFTFEHWRDNVIKSEEESAESSSERPRKKRKGQTTAEQSQDAGAL